MGPSPETPPWAGSLQQLPCGHSCSRVPVLKLACLLPHPLPYSSSLCFHSPAFSGFILFDVDSTLGVWELTIVFHGFLLGGDQVLWTQM